MRTFPLNLVVVAALFATSTFAQQPTPLLTQPADKLIGVLTSEASQKEKADACRQLAVVGTKDAIPALIALLPDEKLSHMARYALETIPDPSVDVAFRSALITLKGRPLVGVIGSIGVRKDTQAVQRLAQLLQDPTPNVAEAAARALGKIADDAAVEALKRGLETAPTENQLAVCEGLLRCAETLGQIGDSQRAAAIYDQLRALQGPPHVRVAAFRGAILVRGKDGIALLRDALRDQDDYVAFSTAVRVTYEVPGAEVTKALARELPRLADDDRKRLVIQALAKRNDSAALAALSRTAKTDSKPIRVAAIQALAETGNPSCAPSLVELLANSDREISAAALDGLSGLPGKQVDSTVQSLLKGRDTARRVAAIELIGRRRMTACLPQLLKAARDADDQIRPAALTKVGELGGPGEVIALLEILPKLSAAPDLDAAEQALSTLCTKTERPEDCTEKLTAKLSQLDPRQKSVVLRVLSTVGGPVALQAVRAAVKDSNADVHAAAIRALGAWKSADAAPDLLALAKSASNPTDQTLSLRSYLGLASNTDVPAAQRLALCRDAVGVVKSNDEKKQLLSALGSIDSPDSVALIMPYLDDAATKEEASAAIASIAERMLKGQRRGQSASKLVQPLEKVAQATTNEDLSKRAKLLLEQAKATTPGQP